MAAGLISVLSARVNEALVDYGDLMKHDDIAILLGGIELVLGRERRLIRIEGEGRVVFAGDTHGDVNASREVLRRYLSPSSKVVFLGDYVDRGPASEENLLLLFEAKLEYPDRLFLLMGNHEGQSVMRFFPADFWEGLDSERRARYASILSRLPLAASTSNGIIALHGALPDVESLSDIEAIEPGSEPWQQVTWGDWEEGGGEGPPFSVRPRFGRDWFEKIMGRLGKNVLIRSHQPGLGQVIYDRRCLTIFTSSIYGSVVSGRTVAVADLSREIRTVDDLWLEEI